MQTWNNVELHCDKIQYREGGIRPDKCLGEMTNVPLLMARPGKFCTEIDSDDVRIPTKPSGISIIIIIIIITNILTG